MSTKIENLMSRIESYGYFVVLDMFPGEEEVFETLLRNGLLKVEREACYLETKHGINRFSKRSIERLHKALPLPFFGVDVKLKPANI